MMDLIRYCLKDLIVLQDILLITNSSFYKRCIARLIAVRTDDFIKLAFSLNKRTVNKQKIKDELNALLKLYTDFFKKQRDKYGAHVQDLSFTERIELWSDIDFDKASFFSDEPQNIYKMFSAVLGYIDPGRIFGGLTPVEIRALEAKNSELDIENSPMMSTDILALTRSNTVGMIYGTEAQNKAGVLKAIELIIRYEMSVLPVLQEDSEVWKVFKKLLILDIVSYCDNLFTRTDISSGAKQAMEGLDGLIGGGKYPTAQKLIDEFKLSYQLDQNINRLRDVRDTVCGHITPTMSEVDLEAKLKSIGVQELAKFYNELENLFGQICSQDFVFRVFSISTRKLHGISSLERNLSKPFSVDDTPQMVFARSNVDSEDEMSRFYDKLIKGEDPEEVKDFFFQGFERSQLIKRENLTVEETEHSKRYEPVEVRKHHEFFRDKLSRSDIDPADKMAIVDLFVKCQHGYPDALREVLLDTYNDNKHNLNLNRAYSFAFGELTSQRAKAVFDILASNCTDGDFVTCLNSLLSMLRIDVKSRTLGVVRDSDLSENEFSQFIKQSVTDCKNPIRKLNYILSLYSEFICGRSMRGLSGRLADDYGVFFKDQFEAEVTQFLTPLIKSGGGKEEIAKIIVAFKGNRFATVIDLMGDLLRDNDHVPQAKNFFHLLADGFVEIVENDEGEVNNLGYALIQLKQTVRAIEVFEFLAKKTPSDIDRRIALLQLYREANRADHFDRLRQDLLTNFNLTQEQRDFINDQHMPS